MRSAATRMRFGFAIVIVFLVLAAVVEFASGALHGGIFSLGGAILVGLIGVRLGREIAQPLDALGDVLHRAAAGDLTARAPLGGPKEAATVYAAANTVIAECEQATSVEETRRLVRRLADPNGETPSAKGPEAALADVVPRVGAALAVDRVFVRVTAGKTYVAQWQRDGLQPVSDELPLLPPDPRSSEPVGTPDAHTNLRGDPILYGDTPRARAARTLTEDADARALVTTRISVAGKPCGALMVMDSGGPRSWTPGELDLLTSVAADLSRMVENAQLRADQRRLESEKQLFIATASHELRTPLASVLGYLELLAVGDFGGLTEDQLNAIRVVERNTTRLHELVLDLLTISGIGPAGDLTERPPVDLSDVAMKVITETEALATEAQLELRYQEKDPATVLGESRQIERALTALVHNAIVFTPAGGSITITLDRDTGDGRPIGTARLAVADTGIGIPEAERGRALEPFYRGTNALERGIAGSGLGLSIVAMVAQQHAGTVTLTARPGGGTEATIHLPLAQYTAAAVSGAIIGWS
ncbi:GAF domain-containing sensor histidine kinase [Cryptosporangium arvum]|uniref:histidine kinase n=1 Tax=Cryptosporangium arvum DSM 44712 TaxID=927661 RepID=A0A010Z0M4_9ACTN|nr:GAF domain-containing sensor histidine kinase [Cryptosporangium arvum]EXG81008.1 signal transduction histidine kinase [Cryptosporangium arvum DSM 44712]